MTWKAGTKLQPMVYNHDFVERNFTQSTELKGVFTLGENQGDTLTKIAVAKVELDKLITRIEGLTEALQGADGTGGMKGGAKLEAGLKDKCWAQTQKRDAKLQGPFEGTLMENRHGLLVAMDVRHATGTSERDAALAMLDERRIGDGASLGADKGYDTREFVQALKDRGIKTHIARNQSGRLSAVDGRTARGKGYAISQQMRKRIEQGFGWAKKIGGLRKLRNVGLPKVTGMVTWTFAAYNLIRMGGIGDWWVAAPT